MRRLAGLIFVLVAAPACSHRPSDKQLQAWSEEVELEEESLKKKGVAAESAGWRTACPTHTKDVKAIVDYRGILVSDILKAVGARETDGPGGKEITFVASDGYVGARKLDEYMRWPVLLAIEQDGVPLVKNTGGPLLEVLPHTTHPESQRIYGEGGAYYVTTLIVGTEKVAVRIGDKTLGQKELGALPERVVEGKHSFRFRWPSGDVRVHGPRLRDVLSAAGVKVTANDKVLVRRKPRTDTPAREVVTIDGDDVSKCDVVLGLRHGSARALIPAVMGGPAVVAFPPACPNASHGQAWPTFVESIEVVPKGDAG